MTKDEALKQALDALETNKQKHDVCEDIFYSCPFYSGGACTCGADKANAEIHEVIASLRQAIAAAKKQKPVAEWLPIETAPKDGTAVLVMRDIWPGSETGRAKRCVGHNTYVAAWWADEGNSGEWVCYMDCIEEPICPIKPTHWMQLPPPPIEAAHGKLQEKNGC